MRFPGPNFIFRSVLVLGTILNGCAKEAHRPALAIDPEFQTYIERFEKVSGEMGEPIRIADLSVRFGATERPTETGACAWNENETPTITINPDTWEKRKSDSDRQLILFHELGHCVLKRNHDSEFVANSGKPLSLMYPTLIDERIYMEDIESYHRKLFDPSKRNQY